MATGVKIRAKIVVYGILATPLSTKALKRANSALILMLLVLLLSLLLLVLVPFVVCSTILTTMRGIPDCRAASG